MPGTASRSPGATSPGRNSSLTTMSPLSQCLPTTRASTGGGVAEPRLASGAGVVGVVERGADVVAHPAVDGDVGARSAAVELDRLDGADLVEREGARPGDRPAGLDRDARHARRRRRAHSRPTISAMPAASSRRRQRVVLGGVGDAEAAAEVELGQLDAVLARDLRRAGRPPGGRRPRSRRCRRSASRCGECSPRSSSRRRAPDAAAPPRRPARRPARSRTSGPRGRWR